MKNKILMFLALTMILMFSHVGAQTTGYLYYAGGGVPDPGDANTNLDGTLTGDNGVFSVLVANVDITAGTVTNWRYATGTSNKLSGHDDPSGYSWMFLENTVHAYNGYLYVGPGDWNNDGTRATADVVAWAEINSNGSLGSWSYSNPIVNDTDDQAICAAGIVDFGGGNAYLYELGGTYSGLDRVAYAKINPDGSLGSWSTTTALPSVDWFNRATVVGNTIIHATGHLNTGSDRHIHYATANPSDGTLGSWQDGGTYDSTAENRWDFGMTNATAGGKTFAVIMGGNTLPSYVIVDTVNVAEVSGGVPGAWSTTNAYPGGAQRHMTAVGADDLIVALGGTTGGNHTTATDVVYLGRIDSSGTITWSTASESMNQPRGMGGAAFYRTEFPVVLNAQNWQLYE